MRFWRDMPIGVNLPYNGVNAINVAPLAVQALELNGFLVDNFLRVQKDDGTPDAIPALSVNNYNALIALINGTSNLYIPQTPLEGIPLPAYPSAPSNPVASSTWYDSSTNSVNYYNGTAAIPINQPLGVTIVATGTGLTGGPITSAGTVALAAVNAAAATATKVNYDIYGRVTGSNALLESDLPVIMTPGKVSGDAILSGTIGGNASLVTSGSVAAPRGIFGSLAVSNGTNIITLSAPASLAGPYSMLLPAGAGASGQVLSTDGNGNLSVDHTVGRGEYCGDGSHYECRQRWQSRHRHHSRDNRKPWIGSVGGRRTVHGWACGASERFALNQLAPSLGTRGRRFGGQLSFSPGGAPARDLPQRPITRRWTIS